jgi:hypothetical protein
MAQAFDRVDAEGRVFVADRLGFLVGERIIRRDCVIQTVEAIDYDAVLRRRAVDGAEFQVSFNFKTTAEAIERALSK